MFEGTPEVKVGQMNKECVTGNLIYGNWPTTLKEEFCLVPLERSEFCNMDRLDGLLRKNFGKFLF